MYMCIITMHTRSSVSPCLSLSFTHTWMHTRTRTHEQLYSPSVVRPSFRSPPKRFSRMSVTGFPTCPSSLVRTATIYIQLHYVLNKDMALHCIILRLKRCLALECCDWLNNGTTWRFYYYLTSKVCMNIFVDNVCVLWEKCCTSFKVVWVTCKWLCTVSYCTSWSGYNAMILYYE